MKVTFGLALDGFRPVKPVFNHLFCGPSGLVDVLELRLGLAHAFHGAAARVAQYARALDEAASHGTRFYSRSLTADRWGTAATLLRMRDDLRMAGWIPEKTNSATGRLVDLEEVEKHAQGHVSMGLSDRIVLIRETLALRKKAAPSMECIDDASHLPWLLRCLLEDLDCRFSCAPAFESAAPGTNLRLIQDHLRGIDVSGRDWNPGDDSVVFANAFSEITLAHAATGILKSGGDCRLLATSPAGILADTYQATRSPALPLDQPSCLRPVAQVLGLALELRWHPPDPAALLQFLTHPACPVIGGLRHRLAEAVAERPGTGSTVWTEVIEKQRRKIRETNSPNPDEQDAKLERIERDLADWILIERFPRQPGAPGPALAETCQRVAEWGRKMAGVTREETISRHHAALASASAELASILADRTTVSHEELTILRELVMGGGTTSGDRIAELGGPDCVSAPGAQIEPTDSVVWWGFETGEAKLPMDWTQAESKTLSDSGIHLQTPEALLASARASAVRPFLAARRRLVLLWPRQRALSQVEPHHLLTLLHSSIPSIPILDLDQDHTGSPQHPANIPRNETPLPKKQRWLRISKPEVLHSREEESFSSITKFIHRPYEWVFDYRARLRKASLMKINLMAQRGNLLHHVVELLLEDGCDIDWRVVEKPDFESWLEETWQNLLETEGANYLQAGSYSEGRRLLEDARRATWTLIGHLRTAGVVSASADVRMEPVPMGDTRIGGIIDLLATNTQGRKAVVDLKYGQGKSKYSELAKNTALQLAVYGRLVREKHSGGDWPDTAYFILRGSELLVQDTGFFPEGKVVKTQAAETGPEATWSAFLDVWLWRRRQLNSGWIEIPVAGTTATDGKDSTPCSTPPRDKWKADESAARYDDYKFLTGWEESA